MRERIFLRTRCRPGRRRLRSPARFVIENSVSRWSGGRLVPMGGGQVIVGGNQLKFTFDKDRNSMFAETIDSDGEVRRFVSEKEWTPTQADLASIKGDWFSEEGWGDD